MSKRRTRAEREKIDATTKAISELSEFEIAALQRELEIPDWFTKGLVIYARHTEEHGHHMEFRWDDIDAMDDREAACGEAQRRAKWFWDYLKNPVTRPIGARLAARLNQ